MGCAQARRRGKARFEMNGNSPLIQALSVDELQHVNSVDTVGHSERNVRVGDFHV